MAWYNTDWQFRKKITIQSGKVDANLTDFPVYLDLSELGADFFNSVKNGGGDIRITKTDEVTEVPREVVSCDTGTDTGEVHFLADGTLSGSSPTDFYIYYGNAAASDYAIDATFGAENVWNSNYKGVWHLEEASGNLVDSTSNDNDLTANGTPLYGQTGQIEDAIDFDGSTDYFNRAEINLGNVVSMSVWINFDDLDGTPAFITNGQKVNGNYGSWRFYMAASGKIRTAADVSTDSSSTYETNDVVISAVTWHNIGFTRAAGAQPKIYIDGVEKAGASADNWTGTIDYDGNSFFLGVLDDTPIVDFLDGKLDETRIMSTVLSANWISTEYNNQNDPSTFYVIGSEENVPVSFVPKVMIF